MNKKSLIFSSILCGLSIATLLFMLIPIVNDLGMSMFYLLGNNGWYYFEEIIWGIAAIVQIVCLPLLILSFVLSILRACNVIKTNKFDLALYIINIVLSLLLVAVIVNLTLGLGRSFDGPGIKFFQGETYFNYASAYYYLNAIFSVAILVLSCINKPSKNK